MNDGMGIILTIELLPGCNCMWINFYQALLGLLKSTFLEEQHAKLLNK